ncbi:MAG: hypothetical protein J3K34DRAFT_403948 [Monoraphidium minutum]|nr:MAG: hypothetical protein J3K34DRAFT_403948 [Monoraphidium minutum]
MRRGCGRRGRRPRARERPRLGRAPGVGGRSPLRFPAPWMRPTARAWRRGVKGPAAPGHISTELSWNPRLPAPACLRPPLRTPHAAAAPGRGRRRGRPQGRKLASLSLTQIVSRPFGCPFDQPIHHSPFHTSRAPPPGGPSPRRRVPRARGRMLHTQQRNTPGRFSPPLPLSPPALDGPTQNGPDSCSTALERPWRTQALRGAKERRRRGRSPYPAAHRLGMAAWAPWNGQLMS